MHHFNDTELCCAPLTSIVHHRPAFRTMVHKRNKGTDCTRKLGTADLDSVQCDVVNLAECVSGEQNPWPVAEGDVWYNCDLLQ